MGLGTQDRPALAGKGHTITVEVHRDLRVVVERTDGRFGTVRATEREPGCHDIEAVARSYASSLGATFVPTMHGWLWDELLTPGEVAAFFRVDRKTVSRWGKAGKLKSIRTPGGHRRYSDEQVRHFLAGGR